jgi:hypothetical protein
MRAWALVLLAGCNRLLGLEPTREIDSPPVPDARPDAVGCSGSKFADTVSVPILLNDAADPDISPDSRTLFYIVGGVLTAMHRGCP